MNNDSLLRLRALSALVAATVVVGCGGGSDAPTPPPPPTSPPPPAVATISGKAVDGPLRGAIACYDINDSKACDSGEPTSGESDVNGAFSLEVATAEVGKHRTIVNVPATAIDADTGTTVGAAFTLVVPATGTTTAHSVFASPLSTLVQQQIDSAGQTQAEAVAYVQAQLGLAVSPLADFTAASNADNLKAANAARLTVSTQKQQALALTTAVGQTDLSGAAVTQANVDGLVVKAVAGALNMIGGAATDASLTGKTGPALASAVAALATSVVTQIGLTVPEAVAAIGVAKLPGDPASTDTPTAGASLSALRFGGADDWYVRSFQASAKDNTLDGGLYLSYEVRTRTEAYSTTGLSPVAVSWAFNNDPARAGELWWSGTAWVGCPLGTRNTGTPRDATGRSNYTYCNNFEKGTSTRSTVDVSGQTLRSVLTDKIRTLPGGAGGVNYANWGPTNLDLLGTATFPTGSKLHYQTNTPLEAAIAYDARDAGLVTVYTQAEADGGDARANAGVACAVAGIVPAAATTLEQIVARSPGKPCVFNQATNSDGTSLDPNEAWFATALSMGNVNAYLATLPAGTGNYYTNAGRLRVSFTGTGNGVVYLQCLERRTPLSTRNCTTIGSGSYTIATLGDARVMTFSNQPAAMARTNFERVFVERGGKVYFGYRNPVGIASPQVRLNLQAANALLSQLGMPGILPADAPQALTGAKAATMATAKGLWGGADATSALVIRFGNNGEFLLAEVDPPGAGGRSGFEQGWLDFDAASATTGRILNVDTNGQWGTSHPQANEGIASISATAITTKGGESFSRLPDSGTGIVGMWALGSATDLKVTQFVFFANGKVLAIHPAETEGPCVAARQGPPGIEWSDYSYTPATGALRIFNKIYDTSGCTGVFDSAAAVPNTEANLVLTMAADGKTFTVPVDGGSVILTGYRIAPQ